MSLFTTQAEKAESLIKAYDNVAALLFDTIAFSVKGLALLFAAKYFGLLALIGVRQ